MRNSRQQAIENATAYFDDSRFLVDLDRQFPGIRFRMIDEQDRVRQHMRVFVNRIPEEDLARPLAPTDEVHIFQALSGG